MCVCVEGGWRVTHRHSSQRRIKTRRLHRSQGRSFEKELAVCTRVRGAEAADGEVNGGLDDI